MLILVVAVTRSDLLRRRHTVRIAIVVIPTTIKTTVATEIETACLTVRNVPTWKEREREVGGGGQYTFPYYVRRYS